MRNIVLRFSGDSGDGVQVMGQSITMAFVGAGWDLKTLPDFPAEIRSPAGTVRGVSSFQMQIGVDSVLTPGDQVDILVALNPAALKQSLSCLKIGGLVIFDEDMSSASAFKKAGWDDSILKDPEFVRCYRLLMPPILSLTRKALRELSPSRSEVSRCRNMWISGLMAWIFRTDLDGCIARIHDRYHGKSAELNLTAFSAGYAFGDVAEWPSEARAYVACAESPVVSQKKSDRCITGAEATAYGLLALSAVSGLPLCYCSYPITPASPLLHAMVKYASLGVKILQVEDEIASATVALGASYAGGMGVTVSSGPGMALKSEALGLAVAAELPLLVIDVQRAGPSTGMPTKTEQSDLLYAMYGRHGDAPLPVLAASSPGDCFRMVLLAGEIACRFMTPVILLLDGYIMHASELWDIPEIPTQFAMPLMEGEPYARDSWGVRPWVKPGTKGGEHCIGGLEKDAETGLISYDSQNHEKMSQYRAKKIENVVNLLPLQDLSFESADHQCLVISWGSSFGSVYEAVKACSVSMGISHMHVHFLNPFARNVSEILSQFSLIIVVELNMAQLYKILCATFPHLAHRFVAYARPKGAPFTVSELIEAFKKIIGGSNHAE